MILISDLLTVLSSSKWFNFISLAVILSSTHPNPNLSKKMIVSLLVARLASVNNLFSFQSIDIYTCIFLQFALLTIQLYS
jgi:hypothetical protein